MSKPVGYVGPNVSVDSIVFQVINDELSVLLIQRRKSPFSGQWALPGGYNPVGETTHQAIARVLNRKAGLKTSQLSHIEQLYTFDTVARDPRGHAITIVYMGLAKGLTPKATTNTEHPQFFAVSQLPPDMAFDHDRIIHFARQRLQSKVTYTNAVFALLPQLFSLSQLQTVYEAILDRPLDKRNFRKKFLSLGLVHPTNEYLEGSHRPAKLYKFNKQSLEILSRSFD